MKKYLLGSMVLVAVFSLLFVGSTAFASTVLSISGVDLVATYSSNPSGMRYAVEKNTDTVGSSIYGYDASATVRTLANLVSVSSLSDGTYYFYSTTPSVWSGCGSGDPLSVCLSSGALASVQSFYVSSGALALTPPAPPTHLVTTFVGGAGTNFAVGGSGTGTGVVGKVATSFHDYGIALVAILSAVIGIGLGYLIFRQGWQAVKNSTGSATVMRK